jgi:uncharacterized protein YueI
VLNIFYNYYKDENVERQKEIDYCYSRILSGKYDKIYIISEFPENVENNIIISGKPSYNDIFKVINEKTTESDINIVINSDCFIDDESLEKLRINLQDNEFWCLTRRDIESINPFRFKDLYRSHDSQDCWIFKGKVNVDVNFTMGISGCDNKIAYLFHQKGYTILNPSKDINVFHYHLTNLRRYSKTPLPKPYVLISPCYSHKKDSKIALVNKKFESKQILFSVFGRSGDIIGASIICNILTYMGYKVTFLTLPMYLNLVRHVCKNVIAKSIPNVDPNLSILGKVNINIKKSKFDYYIDAQVGSDYNHDRYIGSGLSPLEYLVKMVKDVHNIDIPMVNFKDFIWLKDPIKPILKHHKRAIIAPKAITAPCLTNSLVVKIYEDLKTKNYDVKLLDKNNLINEFPMINKEDFLFGYSFVESLYLLKECEIFVGNDSGLAWGSIYSDCTKYIYHWKNRIKLTSNYFKKIDEKFNDILI